MNGELLSVLDAIEREKGIKREILIEAVEAALVSAARKSVTENPDEVTVKLDPQTGKIKILRGEKEISSPDFGRIAAQTAKQVIIQKIRDAERDVIFEEFQAKVGTITNGTVHRFEKGNLIIDLGKTEAVLPRTEQSPRDEYKLGDRVRAVILEVKRESRGPQIVLSRAHSNLLIRLFELEVPEIYEGIVQIRSCAREPGDRAKVAVFSKDEKVDCVGACVGMRGSRVKNIVRELAGEKIDIVRWSEDAGEYVTQALSPAQVAEITVNPERHRVSVVVDDDQLSLAISKKGQNVRLASKLTSFEIDIKWRSVMLAITKIDLTELLGVGPKMKEALVEAKIKTIEDVAKATIESLTSIPGIGSVTASKIKSKAQEMLEKVKEKKPPESLLVEGEAAPGGEPLAPGGGEAAAS